MKNVLITGASRRLGLFLSQKFLAMGWRVHALTRQTSIELSQVANEHLIIYELEKYNAERVNAFINDFRQNFASLDLLVNNASIYEKDEQLLTQGFNFYNELFFIHMSLPALLINGLESAIIEAKGNIISVTDIYADNPNEDYSLYCSTKAGLQNLTLGFAKKLAPHVRANCIQPGPIKFLNEHSDTHKQQVLQETLLPFEGGFDPVFKAVTFILDNPYITGNCIKVDGGRSLVRG